MNAQLFPIPAPGTPERRLWLRQHALRTQEETAARQNELQRLEREEIERRITEAIPNQADVMRVLQAHPAVIIIAEVADKHRVFVSDITGRARNPHIRDARFEAAYRCVMETDMSLPQVGRHLGGRDHSTALHAYRQHAARNGLPLKVRQNEVSA